MNNENKLVVGGEYEHYKGNLYIVVASAILENTMEEAVVYYSMNNPERYWIRSFSNFFEDVKGRPRFKFTGKVKKAEIVIHD